MRRPELYQLPRTKPSSVKSLNFRQTIPGSVNSLLAPVSTAGNVEYLDRTHPAIFEWLTAGRKRFPQYTSPVLGVSAYPKALLKTPDFRWPNPPFRAAEYVSWKDRLTAKANDDTSASALRHGSLDMAFVCLIGKKTHRKVHVRKKLASKLKTATSLIVTRGADAKELTVGKEDGLRHRKTQLQLVLNPDERRSWILRDWVYIFRPTLKVYRLSYPELIIIVRSALDLIWERGSRMENGWQAQSKIQTKMHSGKRASGPLPEDISTLPPKTLRPQSSMTRPHTASTLSKVSRLLPQMSSDVRQRVISRSAIKDHGVRQRSRPLPKHPSLDHLDIGSSEIDSRQSSGLSQILAKAVDVQASDSVPITPVVPSQDLGHGDKTNQVGRILTTLFKEKLVIVPFMTRRNRGRWWSADGTRRRND